MVRSLGQGIGLPHSSTWAVMQGEVKHGQIEGPSGLPLVELLGGPEVLKVLVVCPDLELQLGPFKEVLPFFQCSDNG